MSTDQAPFLARNDWESDFFRREILRLVTNGGVTPIVLRSIIDRAPKFDLIEAYLPADALDDLAVFTQAGFVTADIVLEFSCPLALPPARRPANCEIRPAMENDLAELNALCTAIGFSSRFCRKPFNRADGERFYARWIENAVKGAFDEACFVGSASGQIVSFVSARRAPENGAQIGLIGTAEKWRRAGVTEAIWRRSLDWARSVGRDRMYVATQLANQRALRFYESVGGRIHRTRLHLYLVA